MSGDATTQVMVHSEMNEDQADGSLMACLAVVLEIAQDPNPTHKVGGRRGGGVVEQCRFCEGTNGGVGQTVRHEPGCLWEQCRDLAEDYA